AQPTNADIFLTYVEKVPPPELRPGAIVTMDNLASHKVHGVRTTIEARGATLLYLPPYSPDLNPIEQVFAKLKGLLRSVAARSIPALWHAIGECLARFSPSECANYIADAGYLQSA